MRARPDPALEAAARAAASAGWQLALDACEFHPEGAGAHHWFARTTDGTRWFITCDDLDTKPWLGSERDSVFDGLVLAYSAAANLRAAGASFVVAPTPSTAGNVAVRIDDRYSVSVFEHVDGTPGQWGEPLSQAMRDDLVPMLARLHSSSTHGVAPRPFAVPDRGELEAAFEGLDQEWDGGPLSESTRQLLATHRRAVRTKLADIDRLAAGIADADLPLVLTHGEPHPGNLIHTATGLALIDWDTLALARPERDLWMLAEIDPTTVTRYRDLTGVSLDPDLLAGYRLLWAVTDIALFTVQIRGKHEGNEDNERALLGMHAILGGHEPSPYG